MNVKDLSNEVAQHYENENNVRKLPQDFYYETVDSKGNAIFEISRVRFIDFLETNGFCKFYLNEDNIVYVRIQQNIITKEGVKQVQDFVREYIESLPQNLPGKMLTRDNLKERIFKAPNVFFADNYLSFLKSVELNTERCPKNKGYFYFKNGYVEVDDKGWKLKDYKDLPWLIWDTQIIDFSITIETDKLLDKCEFAQFMQCISEVKYHGVEDDYSEEEIERKNKERFRSLVSITGYLLHTYKAPSRMKSVVLFDQNLTSDPEGGTGKGIFLRGIEKVKKTIIYDGKSFSFDKNFLWQSLNLDTEIVGLEDVLKKFDFERMFSLITDGWTFEKKNMGEVKIKPDKSPKVIITTNYVLEGEGASHDRRKINFELGKFFSESYSPRMHFGHDLYHDWDKDQWNTFYNCMCNCLKFYLVNGIIESDPVVLEKRKLIQQVSQDWIDFLSEWMDVKKMHDDKGNHNFWTKAEIITDFQGKYKDSEKVSSHALTKMVTLFNKYGKHEKFFEEKREKVDGTQQRGYIIKSRNK